MKNIIALKMNPCKSEEKKAEAKRLEKFPGFLYECVNILITIWYTIIVNFQIIFFNYFSGFLAVIF